MGKGFHGVYDAAWMFKRFCQGIPPLEVITEREGLFGTLRAMFGLKTNTRGYTIDPATRYTSVRFGSITKASVPQDVFHLYDTDTV